MQNGEVITYFSRAKDRQDWLAVFLYVLYILNECASAYRRQASVKKYHRNAICRNIVTLILLRRDGPERKTKQSEELYLQ